MAPKTGCAPHVSDEWVKREEVDAVVLEGVRTNKAHRVQDLEREVKDLRQTNDVGAWAATG